MLFYITESMPLVEVAASKKDSTQVRRSSQEIAFSTPVQRSSKEITFSTPVQRSSQEPSFSVPSPAAPVIVSSGIVTQTPSLPPVNTPQPTPSQPIAPKILIPVTPVQGVVLANVVPQVITTIQPISAPVVLPQVAVAASGVRPEQVVVSKPTEAVTLPSVTQEVAKGQVVPSTPVVSVASSEQTTKTSTSNSESAGVKSAEQQQASVKNPPPVAQKTELISGLVQKLVGTMTKNQAGLSPQILAKLLPQLSKLPKDINKTQSVQLLLNQLQQQKKVGKYHLLNFHD